MSPPTVFITGAAGGIGGATASALAASGCRLGLIDRNALALGEVAAALKSDGATVASAPADVTDGPALASAIGLIAARIGEPDVLVACAGIGSLSRVPPDLDIAGLRATLEVNVVGVAQAIEAVLPGMIARGRGHIVGVSSVVGYRGFPWMVSYSASKAATTSYLEGLRPALRIRGITITTVCPGMVRTPLTEGTPLRNPVPIMEPEEAGRRIARAVFRRPRNCVFPWYTALGMSFLRLMPDRAFDWLMDRAGPRALDRDF